MQGMLSFVKKYGVARVEETCALALEMQLYDYGFRAPLPGVDGTTAGELVAGRSALNRQLTLYRDLIQEKTKEPNE